jgi:hypothetical protein
MRMMRMSEVLTEDLICWLMLVLGLTALALLAYVHTPWE